MADEVTPPTKRLVALGFGATALVAAVGVSEYGALVASRPNCVGGCSLSIVGTTSAWAAAAVAAGLLFTVWWIRRAPDDDDRYWRVDVLRGLVWAALALLIVSTLLAKVWSVLGNAMDLAPATMQLSMATVAAGLAIVGMIAVSVGAGVLVRPHRGRLPRAAIAGCIAGLAFSIALTAVGWRVGDDRWYVDASTAADVPVPAVPAQLGQLRFHLQLSDTSPAVSGAPRVSVLQAGAGFVLWDANADALIAYDSSGGERWHYRRTGPGSVHIGAVRVYDEGRTLVLVTLPTALPKGSKPTLIALDAVTGRQLWSASSDALTAAVGYNRNGDSRSTQHFVAREAQTWTGFNPRTGQPIWNVPNPLGCDAYSGNWDTAERLVAVEDCSTDRRLHYRMVTVDPATGHTVLNRAILTMPIDQPSESQRYATDIRRVGSSGLSVTVHPPDRQDSTDYVNADTGAAVDMGDAYLRADSDIAGGFFVHHYPAQSVTMYGADGLERCEFSDDLDPTMGGYNDVGAAWLSQQLAYPIVDSGTRTALTVADRTDCRIVASLPIPGRVRDITAAAGVTVVLYTNETGVYLNGYAP